MRLTNVARMALPPGRLLSYAVRASDQRGPELTVSFDQGRHVGQGQRAGSWMAVAARLPEGATPDQVAEAWLAVVARHGTFSTAFFLDPDRTVRLHQVAVATGDWAEHPVTAGQDPRAVLRHLFDSVCAPFERPSHRLALLLPEADQADQRPLVIIGSDHSHVDMWSFLVVVRDLRQCLDDLQAGRTPGLELAEAASFAEHSAALAARSAAPELVHQRWRDILAAEGGVMPVFPLALGDPDFAGDSIVEVRDLLDAQASARFEAQAKAQGVRMFPLAVSVMTQATLRLARVPLRAVLPVHSRDEERWRDSVGWYITNSVIESADPEPQACAHAVREAIALGSYPLAPILAAHGGMPVAAGMFAISWLDSRRMPVIPADAEVQYVSAVVRDDGVMAWFIANETGLHLRARYPNTPEARANVGAWLDAVEAGLIAQVAPGNKLAEPSPP